MPRGLLMLGVIVAGLLVAVGACAHAFLDRAQPAVGSTVATAPASVSLWFTERIEPAFSTVSVMDGQGARVDRADVHVDPGDSARLIVSLQPIGPGRYTVSWHVVSVDTHITEGDFHFTVSP